MLRRSIRPTTTLDQTKQQLAREESELRDQVQKLERMIADAPRVAEEVGRRQREELLMRASEGGSRLNVSAALQDKRYGDDAGTARPRGSMRKERREGRILFLVLVVALVTAAVWLASHLRF
jgi:septal ring factor EnvC (AmiA/AmiB activator)